MTGRWHQGETRHHHNTFPRLRESWDADGRILVTDYFGDHAEALEAEERSE